MKINDVLQSFIGMPNNATTREMIKKTIDEMIDYSAIYYDDDGAYLDITFDSEEAFLMFKLRNM